MPASRPRHRALALGATLLVASCASVAPTPVPPEAAPVAPAPVRAPVSVPAAPEAPVAAADRSLAARCARAYAALDAAVDAAGVRDAEATRVAGAPSLRVTRFLASLGPEAQEAPAFAQWRALLEEQDRAARQFEIANLPERETRAVRAVLDAEGLGALPPQALLEGCGRALADAATATPEARSALVARATAPDDYDDLARAAGLYPLTRFGFAAGIRVYERTVRDAFAAAPAAPPPSAIAYLPAGATPLAQGEAPALLARARDNPLALPRPSDAELDRLFATHAPTFVVDTRGDADRIGRPTFDREGLPTTTPAPVVFARAVHTRFAGRIRLQIVYTVWFPERPPAYPGDVLAGRLDGVLWRVTLDDDGAPLAFDSIHACGCYHLFVPTARVVAKPAEAGPDEQALVPATLPAIATGREVVVRIDSGTHYVRAVRVDGAVPQAKQRYGIGRDDALRSLPHPGGGTRSLYGPDGLVAGTARAEVVLFWPLGIRYPGAMRQWGRHATAFVGRRHFDEAHLLDRYFAPARR